MKKKVFISIGILAVIIIVLACVLTKCMSGKTTDTDTTGVSTNSDADLAKADSVAEATTEKTKENNDSHDVEAGVTKPTTEHTTEAPEPSTQAPAKPEPTTQAPRPEAPTTERATEAPTEHVHSWKAATCISPKTCTTCGAIEGEALGHDFSVDKPETIHYDAEYRTESHEMCDCGFILDGMTVDQVHDHQAQCGVTSSGYRGIRVLVRDAYDEIVHHYYCSRCGAAK